MLASGTTQTDGTNWADVYWDPVVNVTVDASAFINIRDVPVASSKDAFPIIVACA